MRSTTEDLLLDARLDASRALKLVFVPMGVLLVLIAAGVGIFLLIVSRTTEVPEPGTTDVPLTAYASANAEAFACVEAGPEGCTNYSQSKNYLAAIISDEGLTYTPLTDSDPGETTSEGTKTVSITDDTADEQWQRVSAAVTKQGQATPSSWSFVDAGEAATQLPFTIEADTGEIAGAMGFSTTDEQVHLTSVTFDE